MDKDEVAFEPTSPVGLLLISAFRPSSRIPGTTMPSADFCLLTRYVAIQGAAGFLMRRCLFRGSLEDSYPPTANGHAGFLVFRVNPFRILLMMILPHGKQISPDKDVSFPCTTAAFTLPPEPAGFVVLCQLAQGLSLVCGFCPSARTFALRLPSDGRSPSRPCLRLILLVVFISMNTIGSRTGDFHPISSRPCRAHTSASSESPKNPALADARVGRRI